SGVRLRFETDSAKIALFVAHETPEAYTEHYDVTVDGELVDSRARDEGTSRIELTLRNDGKPRVVELWLPQLCPVVVESLEINDTAVFSEVPDDRLKWITHGSSITHCVRAHSPARIWPAVAARRHRLNLTSLGYGGQCHIDSMMAKMMRDLPANIITLKLGINVHGHGSLNPRSFKPAAIGMIKTIREKHPKTPIGVISPIICPPREDSESNGLSLRDMREELKDAVDRIVRTDGDENLLYFSGLDLFGEEFVGPMLPDDLHPDGDGNVAMGERAAETILPLLLAKLKPVR
ncbi:MAG: hypothetical protein KAG97_03470, partial [Victivallales bacterium]|nr:hypothetical protein [Victivallales bacterium]